LFIVLKKVQGSLEDKIKKVQSEDEKLSVKYVFTYQPSIGIERVELFRRIIKTVGIECQDDANSNQINVVKEPILIPQHVAMANWYLHNKYHDLDKDVDNQLFIDISIHHVMVFTASFHLQTCTIYSVRNEPLSICEFDNKVREKIKELAGVEEAVSESGEEIKDEKLEELVNYAQRTMYSTLSGERGSFALIKFEINGYPIRLEIEADEVQKLFDESDYWKKVRGLIKKY